MDGLRARLQGLVDQQHGGSQNRAAKAWHVHQTTLNRFLGGKTSRLRMEFVQKVARYHQLSIDWLVEGRGTAPALPEGPREEGDAWRALVQSLGLSPKTELAMMFLPEVTGRAFHDLTLRGLVPPLSPGETTSTFHIAPAMARGAWHAARYEYLAWTHLLEGMLKSYGKNAVRAKLEAEWPLLALGYQGLALNLYAVGQLSREAIEAEFTQHAHRGLIISRNYGEPTVPPLEAERVKSGAARGRDA